MEQILMNFRRILGFIILVVGILMMIFSFSIKKRTEEGQQEVNSAQKKVDKASGLFSLTPYTKPVGKGITSSAQKQIDEGKEEITYYENVAKWLKIGGVVVLIAGIVIVAIPSQNKRRR